MQTKYLCVFLNLNLCVLINIWIKCVVGALWNRFKHSSKIFYWPFQGGTFFVDLLCFCSVLCLLCLCARLFICALWSPAGKGLISWLSFVVSNCEFVTFPLVSWYLYLVSGVVLGCIDSWSLYPYLLTWCISRFFEVGVMCICSMISIIEDTCQFVFWPLVALYQGIKLNVMLYCEMFEHKN